MSQSAKLSANPQENVAKVVNCQRIHVFASKNGKPEKVEFLLENNTQKIAKHWIFIVFNGFWKVEFLFENHTKKLKISIKKLYQKKLNSYWKT